MVSPISGSNLAISLRELNQVTPPTQQQTLTQSFHKADQSIRSLKTDTVNISKQALAMSREAEKTGGGEGKPGEQVAEKDPERR